MQRSQCPLNLAWLDPSLQGTFAKLLEPTWKGTSLSPRVSGATLCWVLEKVPFPLSQVSLMEKGKLPQVFLGWESNYKTSAGLAPNKPPLSLVDLEFSGRHILTRTLHPPHIRGFLFFLRVLFLGYSWTRPTFWGVPQSWFMRGQSYQTTVAPTLKFEPGIQELTPNYSFVLWVPGTPKSSRT